MTLTRLLLRRHRLTLTSWLSLLIAMSAGTVTAYQDTYADERQRRLAVDLAQHNAATTLMYGRLPGPGTPAQMYAWEIGAFVTILAAVMAVLVAVSLTRAAEEDGTLELLRGCGLAPSRPLRSAMSILVACAAALTAGCAVAAGLHAGTVDGVSWASAAAYGTVIGATFLVVAAVTVLLAQLTPAAGQARLLGLGVVGLSFAVRALADTRRLSRLNWGTPLGLRATVGPFTADRWPALIVPVVAACLAAAAAVRLSNRREFGAGLLPRRDTRGGRLRIRSATGLTARLDRSTVLTWTAAVAVIGALFAAMGSGVVEQQRGGDVGGFLGAQLAGGDPAAGYLSYCGTVVGIIVGVYAVLSVSRSRTAERLGRTDLVLATGVRRWAPLAAQCAVTAAGAAVVLVATGALTALIAPAVIDGPHVAARAFVCIAGQWPAAAVLIGWSALLAGALPRLLPLAWLPLLAGATLALLGDLLRVPQRVQDLGIFEHVPDATGAGPSVTASLLLTGAAALLCLAGLAALDRRDLRPG
ncbi:hypothetical protein [Actinoplanes sp. L3-i22]|uniref:hypothetical protein n=1 Tax=Actinoplanes sp. L3-i22 TaxID=2836373 RepID=UPI001C7869F7|nr:hypothetical protein [Actinoplanes sp. L3-i22]BCY09494.1 hypothetical protein L3i22_045820 [Actinoplanes sp. L3-i22]